MCSDSSFLRVASYNVGQLFDYRNELLRSGSQSRDPRLQNLYYKVQKDQDRCWKRHRERGYRTDKFSATPDGRVYREQKALIEYPRYRTISRIFNETLKDREILLLQEVKTQDDIREISKILNDNGFDLVVGKNLDNNRTDTAVVWKRGRFRLVQSNANEKGASAQLFDNTTRKTIDVTSIHAQGFTITDPDLENCQKGD